MAQAQSAPEAVAAVEAAPSPQAVAQALAQRSRIKYPAKPYILNLNHIPPFDCAL